MRTKRKVNGKWRGDALELLRLLGACDKTLLSERADSPGDAWRRASITDRAFIINGLVQREEEAVKARLEGAPTDHRLFLPENEDLLGLVVRYAGESCREAQQNEVALALVALAVEGVNHVIDRRLRSGSGVRTTWRKVARRFAKVIPFRRLIP